MTLEFQSNLLKYLFQKKDCTQYVQLIETSIFDLPLYTACYGLLREYVVEYNRIPDKISMLQFFDDESIKAKLTEDAYNQVEIFLSELYDSKIETDLDFTKDKIVEFAKKQYIIKLFEDNADKIVSADEAFFVKIHNAMTTIVNLGVDNVVKYEGQYLLKDHNNIKKKPVQGIPTYLPKLNKLTSAGGFHKPQLVIIMGGPKGFKTGVTLSIVVNYVRDGLKVFFADAENSVDSIINRARMCMLGCTREELYEGVYDKELDAIVKGYKALGGEMRAEYFPSEISTLQDVDDKLEQLKAEDGFVPDLIVYDYLDLFSPVDKRIIIKRLQIQNVYHHAIRLNNKWGCFAFSPSQINKAAIGKETIDLTDFAEDFAKAANCHAAFGIAGTDEMREQGFARLVPVLQREGVRQSDENVCPLVIDESRMIVEYDEEYWDRIKVNSKLDEPKTQLNKPTFKYKGNKDGN